MFVSDVHAYVTRLEMYLCVMYVDSIQLKKSTISIHLQQQRQNQAFASSVGYKPCKPNSNFDSSSHKNMMKSRFVSLKLPLLVRKSSKPVLSLANASCHQIRRKQLTPRPLLAARI